MDAVNVSKMHDNLIEMRRENETTQKDMAELLGLVTATYCKKENGSIPFTLWEAKKVADRFKRSIDVVFFGR